jgi:DNA-binding response OmpR family regulator
MVECDPIIHTHGIVIDPMMWEVSIEGRPVTLSKTEFLLLRVLASRSGFARTRQQIIDAVHGPDYPATERSVDVQVTGLRKKLGDLGRLIETVRGVGYRFRGEWPIGSTTGEAANTTLTADSVLWPRFQKVQRLYIPGKLNRLAK